MSKKNAGFALTERDATTIVANCLYRALTTNHVGALLYCPPNMAEPVSFSRCQKRLKFLTDEGYLQRIEQYGLFSQGKKPYVYMPTKKGVAFASKQLGEDFALLPRPKALFLPHLLAINDVRICFEKALRVHGLTLEFWLDEATLRSTMMEAAINSRSTRTQPVTPVPDGYCVVDAGKTQHGHFFFEIDLGTEQVKHTTKIRGTSWEKKVTNYLDYIRSGRFHDQFEATSLRILVVTTSHARLKNLKEVTEQAGGENLFWFTTREEAKLPTTILADPLWQVAGFDTPCRVLDPDPI